MESKKKKVQVYSKKKLSREWVSDDQLSCQPMTSLRRDQYDFAERTLYVCGCGVDNTNASSVAYCNDVISR